MQLSSVVTFKHNFCFALHDNHVYVIKLTLLIKMVEYCCVEEERGKHAVLD